MSSKVNVHDESLLLDNPEYQFLEPMLKKLRVRSEALPLLNLHYLDKATAFATASAPRQKKYALSGSGAALLARLWKRTRSWSILTCLAFWRQSQVYQALAQTVLERHVRGLIRSRKNGSPVLSIHLQNFPSVQARLAACARSCWQRPPPQRPRDHRAHEFIREPAGTRVWVLTSPARRTADYLRALRVRRPRPLLVVMLSFNTFGNLPSKACDGGPSHLASLHDRQVPLEHRV